MIGVVRRKDFLGGLLMTLIGLGTVLQAQSYDFGSLRRMGPGFFPLVLGIMLGAVGAVMMLAAWRAPSPPDGARRAPEWRGWIGICAGLAAFCLLGATVGLIPATFALVFIAALGDRENTVRTALVLALAIVLTGVVIFWWALGMQFPLLAWG